MEFELSPEQLIYLGIAASLIVLVLRFVYELLAKRKLQLPDWVMNLIVFAVALVFALLWMPQALPTFPFPTGDPAVDVMTYLSYFGQVLVSLTLTLSFAVFIYKYLIIKVKDGLGRIMMPRLYK